MTTGGWPNAAKFRQVECENSVNPQPVKPRVQANAATSQTGFEAASHQNSEDVLSVFIYSSEDPGRHIHNFKGQQR